MANATLPGVVQMVSVDKHDHVVPLLHAQDNLNASPIQVVTYLDQLLLPHRLQLQHLQLLSAATMFVTLARTVPTVLGTVVLVPLVAIMSVTQAKPVAPVQEIAAPAQLHHLAATELVMSMRPVQAVLQTVAPVQLCQPHHLQCVATTCVIVQPRRVPTVLRTVVLAPAVFQLVDKPLAAVRSVQTLTQESQGQ